MTIYSVTAEHGGLIKKRKTESSWVKLKAFPTDVGRPENDKMSQSWIWAILRTILQDFVLTARHT